MENVKISLVGFFNLVGLWMLLRKNNKSKENEKLGINKVKIKRKEGK
jgi:hypothetical protein